MKLLRESHLLSSLIGSAIILLLAFILTSCNAVHDSSYQAHIYEDNNGSEIQDNGESNLQGINIQIINPTNGLLWLRSITDASGNIDELSAGGMCGDYILVLSVPEGYRPTTPVHAKTSKCEIAQFGLWKNQ